MLRRGSQFTEKSLKFGQPCAFGKWPPVFDQHTGAIGWFQTSVWTPVMTDPRVTSVSQTRLGTSGSAKPQALPVRKRKLNLHVFP